MSTGRWVNACITIVVPLDDVSVNDSNYAKMEATIRVHERLIEALPPEYAEHVSSGRWEDAGEGPPDVDPDRVSPEEGLRRFRLSVEQAKGEPPPKMVPISPRPT